MSAQVESKKGTIHLGSDLTAASIETRHVPNTKVVTSVALSPDAKYLAVGDVTGRVTLRDMRSSGKRFPIAFNAGKNVGISAMVWLRSTSPYTIFIASGNGYLNCITFSSDVENNSPRNTAIKTPGLISCLAVNDDESQIAVSYDYTTKVFSLPFEEGDAKLLGKSAGRLVNQDYPGDRWHLSPVRNHPRAVSLHYIDKYTLMVAFFAKLEAYDTDPGSKIQDKLWTIVVPEGTSIGSCALSPSRRVVAATNLQSGLDWYSIHMRRYMSETKIEDIYEEKNQVLPVAFLSEGTIAAGHNLGCVTLASMGMVATNTLGRKRGSPSQHLAVSRLNDEVLLVYAYGSTVIANTIQCIQQEAVSTATSITLANPITTSKVASASQRAAFKDSHRPIPIPLFEHSTPNVQDDLSFISQYTQFKTPAETPGPHVAQQVFTAIPSLVNPPIPSTTNLDHIPAGNTAMDPEQIDDGRPEKLPDFGLHERPKGQRVTIADDREDGDDRATHIQWRDFHRDSSNSSRSHSPERVTNTPESGTDDMTFDLRDVSSPLDGKGAKQQRGFAPPATRTHSRPPSHSAFNDGVMPPRRNRPSRSRSRDQGRRSRSSRHRDGNAGGEDNLWDELLAVGWVQDYINCKPKFILLTLACILVAVLVAWRSMPTPHSQTDMDHMDPPGQPAPQGPIYAGPADEYDDDTDADVGDWEEDGDEAKDTIIITETKIMTVTRTVTSTSTVTATVTAGPKPKHTKARRDRRARPSPVH